MTTKTTRKDNYATLADLVSRARDEGIAGYNYDKLETFINKEVESLDKKAEAARKRADKKKEAGDEMRETLYGLLTSEAQTITDLLPQMQQAMNDSTISPQKLTARLKQLVDLNRVEKFEVTIPGGDGQKSRRVMGYALSGSEVEG